MDLIAELANVSRALDGAGVPYAVCGGIAVTIHGHVRATKDIDLLIRPEDRDRALDIVAGLGPTLRLIAVGPLYEGAWSERESYEWEGTTLTVVSLEVSSR